MILKRFKYTYLLGILFIVINNCHAQAPKNIDNKNNAVEKQIVVGAAQLDKYLPNLKGKNVGIVTNQTGIISLNESIDAQKHLVDFLLENKINIKKIFAPEHGFRGTANAGEHVKNGVDTKTNLPIISLYGDNKKPTKAQFEDLDVIVFDIQDVGVRFYTYISTLHYIMETAAENGKKVIVLDRPNPNGHYIDGPVLEKKFTSFVGMHPVPVVYGMTIGEYAQMINGEKWLEKGIKCDLKVIPLQNYTHNSTYVLPVKPSPNLANVQAINLYPSTCFFEGTMLSEGRGTDNPFVIYGSPYLKNYKFSFTPKANEGSKDPKFKNVLCFGENLKDQKPLYQLELKWILNAYKANTQKPFFLENNFFDKLAGNARLRQQIEVGKTEAEIRKTWQADLSNFKKIRSKYLLYP